MEQGAQVKRCVQQFMNRLDKVVFLSSHGNFVDLFSPTPPDLALLMAVLALEYVIPLAGAFACCVCML